MNLNNYSKIFHPGETRLEKQFLVGRDEELRQIDRILSRYDRKEDKDYYSNHILITGHRGIGKTSLLNYILRRFYKEENPPVYAECNRESDFSSTIRLSLEGLGVDFDIPSEKTTKTKTGSGGLNIPFVGKMTGGTSRVETSEAPSKRKSCETPDEAFRIIASEKRKVLVAIDEASEVPFPSDSNFWEKLTYLARMMSNQSEAVRNSRLIICGLPETATRMLRCHSSIARNIEHFELKPITDEAFYRLLKLANTQYGIGLPNELMRTLVDEAGGFPHYIHVMGAASCEQAIKRGENQSVSMTDYANAFYQQYVLHKPAIEVHFRSVIDNLANVDRNLLRVISEWERYSFSVKDIEQRFRIEHQEARRKFKVIEDTLSSFVRRRRSGQKLCFRAAFVKAYCRERMGLSRYWGSGSSQLPLFMN